MSFAINNPPINQKGLSGDFVFKKLFFRLNRYSRYDRLL